MQSKRELGNMKALGKEKEPEEEVEGSDDEFTAKLSKSIEHIRLHRPTNDASPYDDDDDGEEVGETAFLIPKPAKSNSKTASWFLKMLVLIALGIIMALVPAYYAFAFGFGVAANQLTKETLQSASGFTLLKGVTLGFSSSSANIPLNVAFSQGAIPRSKETFRNMTKGGPHIATGSIVLLLAVGSGIAAFALGYEAFVAHFGPFATFALAFAGNALPTSITRFLGAANAVKRIRHWLTNQDAKLQQHLAQMLSHLNPALKETFTRKFERELKFPLIQRRLQEEKPRSEHEPVTNEEMEEILTWVVRELAQLQQQSPEKSIILDKTTLETVTAHTKWMTQSILALALGGVSFLPFAIAGSRGINTLLDFINPEISLTNSPLAAKLAIGACSGIATSLLYGLSAFDFIDFCKQMVRHLRQHPHKIPLVALYLPFLALSATSLTSVARSNSTPLGFDPDNPDALFYLYCALITVAGGIVNITAPMRLFFPVTPARPTLPELSPQILSDCLKTMEIFGPNQLLAFLERTKLPAPNDNLLQAAPPPASPNASSLLQTLTLFKPIQKPAPDRGDPGLDLENQLCSNS